MRGYSEVAGLGILVPSNEVPIRSPLTVGSLRLRRRSGVCYDLSPIWKPYDYFSDTSRSQLTVWKRKVSTLRGSDSGVDRGYPSAQDY